MRVRSFPAKIAFLMLAFAFAIPAVAQQPRKESLLNGLKVRLFPDASTDKVSVRIRINSGAAFDPQGKEGLMQLLAANFFPTDAAKEYFRDELGGSLAITTNYDYIEVAATARADQLLPMLETLSTDVAGTDIDKDTTAKIKADVLAKLKTMNGDTAYIADRAAAQRLFGTFPYGRPIFGTEASIGKIDFADLHNARDRFLTADNATMTISGNFQPTRAMAAVKRYFGSWLKSDKRVPSTFRQAENPPTGLFTVASPVDGQFAIRYALRGTARSGADMPAADIYTRILEARLRARVPSEYAANVFVRSEAYLLPGWILIGFSGTRSDVNKSKIEANDIVPKALADPITDAEFTTARTAAAAEWAKRTPEEFWLDVDTYNLTPQAGDRIFDAVTAAKVRDFAAWVSHQPAAAVLVTTPL